MPPNMSSQSVARLQQMYEAAPGRTKVTEPTTPSFLGNAAFCGSKVTPLQEWAHVPPICHPTWYNTINCPGAQATAALVVSLSTCRTNGGHVWSAVCPDAIMEAVDFALSTSSAPTRYFLERLLRTVGGIVTTGITPGDLEITPEGLALHHRVVEDHDVYGVGSVLHL